MAGFLAYMAAGAAQGAGQGIVAEAKAKREAALATLEHSRTVQREESSREFQRSERIAGEEFRSREGALDRAATAAKSGGATEYGLTPQTGVDADGNPVLIQLGKDGSSIQTPLPDGVSLSREPIRMDAGTHFVLLDPITRQQIGTVPKENYREGYETAAGSAQGKADVERAIDAPAAIQQADTMLTTIDEILNDENLGWATGVTGGFLAAIPGTETRGTRARMNKLEGQAFLQAFESLKGGGAITEIEGQKATQAIAALDAAQNETDYRRALNSLRAVVVSAKARAERVQSPGPDTQRGGNDTAAAASGSSLRDKYGLE